MLSRDKILKEASPLSIFFVKSGSGGNRLLFRFPYDDNSSENTQNSNLSYEPTSEGNNRQRTTILGENDEALSNMFSVNPNLCGQKFEIKINNVRHVGHPMSLLSASSSTFHPSCLSVNQQRSFPHSKVIHNLNLDSYVCSIASKSNHNINQGDITSFNIVCSLRASASFDIVDCYHDLSKRLAIALSFEERRCSYLSKEIKTILSTLEESDMAKLTEEQNQQEQLQSLKKSTSSVVLQAHEITKMPQESVFSLILNRSNLAKDLRKVYISMCNRGFIDLKINNWISVSFCLPQKVHRLKLITHKSMPAIGTRDIKKCLRSLRPYHGLLLLYEPQELLDSLPLDASPAFIQLIRVIKPDKNFMDLSVDANLSLMQIFCIVSQLVYWSKATIIYPICDSNIYAIHPLASTCLKSSLVSEFKARFPNNKSLHHYLADFSEGTSLSQLNGPLLSIGEKQNLLSIVTWLLQRRILTQVHKYIFLIVDDSSTKGELVLSSNRSQVESEDVDLIIKLMPYFNGKHHLEDIMFFENLKRSQVLILCDKFRDILFTCHYEDVAVSQLSPIVQ